MQKSSAYVLTVYVVRREPAVCMHCLLVLWSAELLLPGLCVLHVWHVVAVFMHPTAVQADVVQYSERRSAE